MATHKKLHKSMDFKCIFMMCIWLVEQLMFSGIVMNLCFEPFTSCNTHWMLNKKTSKCSFFCKQASANSTFPLPLPPY